MPHLHDKIDFSATAYVVYNDTVLLRLHDKHNRWLGVGGHVELDEDPVEAVIREVKEEIGLDVKLIANDPQQMPDGSVDLPLPMFLNRHRINDSHEHVDFLYAVRAASNNIQPQDGEIMDANAFRWMTAADIQNPENNVEPRVAHHALNALSLAKHKHE